MEIRILSLNVLSLNVKFLISVTIVTAIYSFNPKVYLATTNNKSKPIACNATDVLLEEPKFESFVKNCTCKIDWTEILKASKRLIFVDDGLHSENASKAYLASIMGTFKKAGITHLALEMFDEDESPLVTIYLKTGKGRDKIREHLQETTLCPEVTDDLMKIVDAARKYKIEIVAITPNLIPGAGGGRELPDLGKRDEYAANKITGLLANPKNRVLVIIGGRHMYSDSLPSIFPKLTESRGIPPVEMGFVHIMGMERERIMYFEFEKFKLERVIRNAGRANDEFMFTRGQGAYKEFFIELPQTEEPSPLGCGSSKLKN